MKLSIVTASGCFIGRRVIKKMQVRRFLRRDSQVGFIGECEYVGE
jgi:hypothetical protein